MLFSPAAAFPGKRCSKTARRWAVAIKQSVYVCRISFIAYPSLVLLQIHQPGGGAVRLKALTDQFRPAAAGAALGDGVREVLYGIHRRQKYASNQQHKIICAEKVASVVSSVLVFYIPPLQTRPLASTLAHF